jgi:FixJ family two-component response regulator
MSDHDLTIYVIDDDDAVRDSLAMLIAQEGYPVETYAGGEQFLQDCSPDCRGCAIIDLRMPGMDGLRLQQEMDDRGLLLPIIFLSGHGDIPSTVRAIKAGAIDFLTKPITRADLMATIQAALGAGERLRARAIDNDTATSRLLKLTGRERDVMALAVRGLSNKEIARRLDISHRTVEIHKARVLRKTGVATVIELTRVADAAGFFPQSLPAR